MSEIGRSKDLECPGMPDYIWRNFSENWFNSHVGAIVATVAGLCVFEIITMILSFWLVRSGYSYEMIA